MTVGLGGSPMKNLKSAMMFGASALALVGVAAPAAAQNSGAQLEEVVVTARRVAENLQDVPVAVTAMSAAQLNDNVVKSVKDLQSMAPSVFIATGGGGASTASIGIRGQTQADTLITSEGSVAVYIDNVALPRQIGLRSSLFDVESVQILKGSQGTLFGKNTTGGALLYTTKAPSTTEAGGYANLTLAEYGYYQVSVAGNYPVIEDKLGLRVAAVKTKSNGFGQNAIGVPLGNLNDESVRLGVMFTPTDNIRIRLSADNTRTRQGQPSYKLTWINPYGVNMTASLNEIATQLGLLPITSEANRQAAYRAWVAAANTVNVRDTNSVRNTFSHLDIAGLMGDVQVDFGDLTFRSITGQRWINRNEPLDQTATPFVFTSAQLIEDQKSFTQEFQIISDKGANLTWILGAYYSREEGNDESISRNQPNTVANTNHQEFGAIHRSKAIFGQGTYRLSDSLRATAGLRYSWISMDYIGQNRTERPLGTFISCSAPAVLITPGKQCEVLLYRKDDAPSYLLSLDWKPTEDTMVYAKTASSFRSGGINPRGNAQTVASYDPFGPEKTRDYEVGIKTEAFGNRLRFDGAAYLTKYKNVQKSTVTLVGVVLASRIDNAAQATVKGLEGEITARPIDPLTIRATASWTKATYDVFVDNSGDRSGEKFPVPKHQFSMNAKYVIPTALGDGSIFLSYRWQDDVVYQSTGLYLQGVTQGDYGIWDARIAVNLEGFNDSELALFAKNINNKTYYTSATTLDRTLGFNFMPVGDPRVIGVEFKTRFGGG